jgi:carbohydrate-selective porin OprB
VVTQLHAAALWDLVEHPVLGRGSLGVYFVDARKFLGRSAGDLSEHCDTSLAVNDGDIDEPFTALEHLWWEQRFLDERLGVLAGQIELQDLMNANTHADDDTFSFLAQPVATNPATVIVPAGLGVFAQVVPSERGYLSLAFVDAGVDEEECDLQQVLGTGVVLRRPFGRARDWIGFAFMWGDVSDDSRSDEYALETYWRIHLTERLELTPDLQIHVHPDRGDGVSLMDGLRIAL